MHEQGTVQVGLPARNIVRHSASHARSASRPRPSTRCSAAQAARCRHTFFLALTVLLVFTAAGLARVALTTEAARAAFAAGELQDTIKQERLKGDMLEIDKSSLSTPSRIEAVACATMAMAEAADVRYINVPCETPTTSDPSTAEETVASPGVSDAEPVVDSGAGSAPSGLMQAVLELAADEAHVLLVGDVGLSSSR